MIKLNEKLENQKKIIIITSDIKFHVFTAKVVFLSILRRKRRLDLNAVRSAYKIKWKKHTYDLTVLYKSNFAIK
jgi:hypothetical protein